MGAPVLEAGGRVVGCLLAAAKHGDIEDHAGPVDDGGVASVGTCIAQTLWS